jgi:hypothetical protein
LWFEGAFCTELPSFIPRAPFREGRIIFRVPHRRPAIGKNCHPGDLARAIKLSSPLGYRELRFRALSDAFKGRNRPDEALLKTLQNYGLNGYAALEDLIGASP